MSQSAKLAQSRQPFGGYPGAIASPAALVYSARLIAPRPRAKLCFVRRGEFFDPIAV